MAVSAVPLTVEESQVAYTHRMPLLTLMPIRLFTSVVDTDPNPQDPYVSGSLISGSFHQQGKKSKKSLDFSVVDPE
jgi:hypothetical protein